MSLLPPLSLRSCSLSTEVEFRQQIICYLLCISTANVCPCETGDVRLAWRHLDVSVLLIQVVKCEGGSIFQLSHLRSADPCYAVHRLKNKEISITLLFMKMCNRVIGTTDTSQFNNGEYGSIFSFMETDLPAYP